MEHVDVDGCSSIELLHLWILSKCGGPSRHKLSALPFVKFKWKTLYCTGRSATGHSQNIRESIRQYQFIQITHFEVVIIRNTDDSNITVVIKLKRQQEI